MEGSRGVDTGGDGQRMCRKLSSGRSVVTTSVRYRGKRFCDRYLLNFTPITLLLDLRINIT